MRPRRGIESNAADQRTISEVPLGAPAQPIYPWVPRPDTAKIAQTHGTGISAPVIYVTRLDGSMLVVNADLIETVEHTADTVITLLDGKKLVVATPVDELMERVLAYRQAIARGPLRSFDSPPMESAAAAVHHLPTPIRPREHKSNG